MIRLMLITALVISLLYCANMHAGGGTDNPNSFVGTVAYANGKPAPGATVRMIDKSSWLTNAETNMSVVIESTFTDSNGRFSLIAPDSAQYTIEAACDSGSVIVWNRYPFQGETLYLKPWVRFRGLVTGTEKSSGILFGGTSFRTSVAADNTFDILRIPRGNYPLVALVPCGALTESRFLEIVSITGDSAIQDDTLTVRPDTLLVDNFSLGFPQTSLGILTNGFWYDFVDKYDPYNGNSDVVWDTVSSAAAWQGGPSLACSIYLREGFTTPFGGIGFFIGSCNKYYDLSTVTSLVLIVKGKGSLRISFETHELDTLSGNGAHFGITVSLPAQWSRMVIPLDSLTVPPDSKAFQMGYTWAQVAHQVQRIEFGVYGSLAVAGDTTELWLDDIKMSDIQLEILAQ